MFLLLHLRAIEGRPDTPWADQKVLGFFSSRKNAETARSRANKLEGFRDYPDGFIIEQIGLGTDRYPEGFDGAADYLLAVTTYPSE
ncbi:MAG: hypothetical protein ACOH1T_12315 [Microbacteriaceae bacterium]